MNLYRITGTPPGEYQRAPRLIAAETLVKAHKLSGFDDAAIASVENLGEIYAIALREEDLVQNIPDGRLLTADEIKASISSDGWTLRSFEDGHLYKTLVLHLKAHGLTPAQYIVVGLFGVGVWLLTRPAPEVQRSELVVPRDPEAAPART